jgi:hypothetical protein
MVKVLMLIREGVGRLRRRIKIMKADGTVMKLRSPVSVKEILIDYPNHEIFETAAFGGVGIGSLSLPERAGLVSGHLYYLIPLPLAKDELINYNNNSKRGPFARASSYHSIPSTSSWLQTPSSAGTATVTDSIRQREEADDAIDKIYIRDGVRIVSSSYSTHGSIVRVKLRLRKEELASFLSSQNANIVMENVVVAPSIQGATPQTPWKPRLDTIAETHSPLGDL